MKTLILAATLTVSAVQPTVEPPPPPITLTHEQVMVIRASIEQLEQDKQEAQELAIYWYKKAQGCRKTPSI